MTVQTKLKGEWESSVGDSDLILGQEMEEEIRRSTGRVEGLERK